MIADGSYPSLLQGVSQQVIQHRRDGQLSEQINMLSDAVTGIRRRAGITFKHLIPTVDANFHDNALVSEFVEYEDNGYHLIIDTTVGYLYVYDEDWNWIITHSSPYLIAWQAENLVMANQGGYTWFLNRLVKPALGTSGASKLDPQFYGWANVLVGAFSKTYTIRITVESIGYDRTFTHTTPDGSNAAHVAQATAEGIASAFATQMSADAAFLAVFDFNVEGGTIWFGRQGKNDTAGTTRISTTSGSTYMRCSGVMRVAAVADLPARLHDNANNCLMTVGSNSNSYSYFRWDGASSTWIESSSFDSADFLINTPIRHRILDGVSTLEAPSFEGRKAGDDNNNPYPAFLTFGITGISAYQGRLVFLASAFTCMSASNKPLRFMRSTTVDLRTDDPIEISAGSLVNANFQYAVPFNKDLLLFSSTHQAVIPAGNTAITPQNALAVLSSNSSVNTLASPKIVGRTLMYSTDISAEFFGVGEMVPSTYSDSQYTAQNLTDHIPRYMRGSCRGIVSSSSTNLVLFLGSVDRDEVLLNEYIWNGEERLQSSWHKWRLPSSILSVHFARGVLVFCMRAKSNQILIGTVDTRAASYQQTLEIPPFLEYNTEITVTDNQFEVPDHLTKPELADQIRLAYTSGDLSGEPIGIESLTTGALPWTGRTIRSFKNGTCSIGWKFRSEFTPTPPLIKNNKTERPIPSMNTNVLRYVVSVRNTGEFHAEISIDNHDNLSVTDSALLWSSTELGLGSKQAVGFGKVKIPVRADSERHLCTLYTDSTRELNVTDIEYTVRGAVKRQQL